MISIPETLLDYSKIKKEKKQTNIFFSQKPVEMILLGVLMAGTLSQPPSQGEFMHSSPVSNVHANPACSSAPEKENVQLLLRSMFLDLQ